MTQTENKLTDLVKPGEPMDWVSLYEKIPAENLPWYLKELDEDLAAELDKRSISSGKFLDLGTGPATQAIALAKRGFDVTGSDVSGPGIEKARARAADIAGLKFVVDNIISTKISDVFDYIFDRGCFHVFNPQFYDDYLKNVCGLLRKDGLLFLKCFAEGEEMDHGPKCFSVSKLAKIFSDKFTILSVRPAEFAANTAPGSLFQNGHKALFSVMQRR